MSAKASRIISLRGLHVGGMHNVFASNSVWAATRFFSIALYGEEAAFTMASGWCHRIQWIYDAVLTRGGEIIIINDTLLNEYAEPDEVGHFYRSSGPRAQARIEGLRAIVPRYHGGSA